MSMDTKKPILITCYVNPDLDGVASAIAYSEYLDKTGKNTIVGIIGTPHDEVTYVLKRFNLNNPEKINNSLNFDKIILVDSSDLNGLEGKIEPEKVIEIIDHRKINEVEKFVNAKIQIELVGAAATLIAEKYFENKIAISKESAILLYSAIISNTLNFKGGVTTEKDITIAHWLNDIIKLDKNYWQELFLAKSDLTGTKLIERMRGDLAWFVMGDKKVGIAQIEMIGAKKLIDNRINEITAELNKIKKEMDLDYVFQNTIELAEEKNYFITDDLNTQKLLEKILDVKFHTNIEQKDVLIISKQIVPLIKEYLEVN
jgi:manganese-dependent inorganic pyrophosphatase